jgi:SAM-dependent methyltransferase
LHEHLPAAGAFQGHRLDLCRECRRGAEEYVRESQGLYTLHKGRHDLRRAIPARLRSKVSGEGIAAPKMGPFVSGFSGAFLLLPRRIVRRMWISIQVGRRLATLRLRNGPAALFLRSFPGDLSDAARTPSPLPGIGRPQKELVRLEQSGEIRGRVLEVGCGTGEDALYLAGLGYPTLGVDIEPGAVEQAKWGARARNTRAEFQVWDALELPGLHRRFDTVVDTGLFHTLSDAERATLVHGLAAALRPEGTYQMLCFSEREPGSDGPRRVTQAEIRAAFGDGWKVESIRKAKFETRFPAVDAQAWVSSITRLRAGERAPVSADPRPGGANGESRPGEPSPMRCGSCERFLFLPRIGRRAGSRLCLRCQLSLIRALRMAVGLTRSWV